MSVWVLTVLIIEVIAVMGTISVLVTKRLRVAFGVGFNTMLLVTGVYIWSAPPLDARKVAIFAMVVIYLLHMNWLLLFRQRYTALPKLERLPGLQQYVWPLVLTNVVGWGYCLPFYFAARRMMPLGWEDYVAFGVYVVGTVIHFGSDYQKQRFKAKAGPGRKLLDTGFWSLCRHPNYFGDFLIYVAFGLISGSVWGWVAPVLNLLQYVFDAIPKSEAWLAERYGEGWDGYRRRVRKFIPFVW